MVPKTTCIPWELVRTVYPDPPTGTFYLSFMGDPAASSYLRLNGLEAWGSPDVSSAPSSGAQDGGTLLGKKCHLIIFSRPHKGL